MGNFPTKSCHLFQHSVQLLTFLFEQNTVQFSDCTLLRACKTFRVESILLPQHMHCHYMICIRSWTPAPPRHPFPAISDLSVHSSIISASTTVYKECCEKDWFQNWVLTTAAEKGISTSPTHSVQPSCCKFRWGELHSTSSLTQLKKKHFCGFNFQ